MDCERLKNHTHEYLKGLLPYYENKEFEEHINLCKECNLYISSSKTLLAGLQPSEEPNLSFVYIHKHFIFSDFLKKFIIPAFAISALLFLIFMPFETEESEDNLFFDTFTITSLSQDQSINGHILEDITLSI